MTLFLVLLVVLEVLALLEVPVVRVDLQLMVLDLQEFPENVSMRIRYEQDQLTMIRK